MGILKTKHLSKVYGSEEGINVKALTDLSIDVEEGEFVGIMGPSGSGKSTLLNILATIDKPSSGEVLIDKENPYELSSDEVAIFRRKKLGFVFQEFNLLDTLTVKENILLPLILEEVSSEEMNRRLEEIVKTLGIDSILNKKPYEISGGQQQRTAVARALINHPKVILADEPTGSLDSKSSFDLMESLENLNQREKATIVMVTHDAFAASFCNRIIMIRDGKYFLELVKDSSRQIFFKEIIDSLSLLGGGYNGTI